MAVDGPEQVRTGRDRARTGLGVNQWGSGMEGAPCFPRAVLLPGLLGAWQRRESAGLGKAAGPERRDGIGTAGLTGERDLGLLWAPLGARDTRDPGLGLGRGSARE